MAAIKVFKADRFSYNLEERAFPHGADLASMDEVRAFARRILASDWWNQRCALTQVSVLSTRSPRMSYSQAGKAAIHISGYHWSEYIIIHELCHQLTDSRHGYSRHNEKFMYWLFRMNQQFNSGFTTPEQWAKADATYLEAGINVGADDPRIEGENLGRVKAAPPEVGPVWQKRGVVGYATHIPVPEVHLHVVAAGKSIASFVKAMGGQGKGIGEPIAEWWRPVYAGRSRWLPKECLEHLDQLANARGR